MKRAVSAIVCLLLLFTPIANLLPVAEAAPVFKVSEYSVSGVSYRPNAYTITMKMTRTGDNLTSLQLAIGSGAFELALPGGTTVTKEPLSIDVTNLNNNGADSYTAYVIKTDSGASNSLTLNFIIDGDTVNPQPFALTVIKTTPEYPDPVIPDPTPVDTTKYKPVLEVATDAAMPVLTPESTKLVIPIKNNGVYSSGKITIQVQPADQSKPLFAASRMSVNATLNGLANGSTKDAEFGISLAPGATTGIHAITLNYSFKNSYGDSFTSTETAYVQVEAHNSAPRLGAYCATSSMAPGTETKTKFTIKNSGNNDARNIRVTLSGLSASGVSLRKDTDVRYLDKIAGQESADVEFNLYAASSISESAAMLQVKLDYTDMSGVGYSETNTIFLPLGAGGGDGGQGVPRLIINRYGFGSQGIRAGSQFLLELDLQNTSRSKSITNLKVTVQSDDGAFLPVDASNTLFIEQILPQEVYSTSLLLAAKADAENKPYSLRITFDYETNGSQALNSQEVISIPVQQNPRLMVNDPVLYGQPFVYQMIPINVEFYNLGKTILYNLIIKAEGPFQIEGGSYFVGNFNPGSSDSFNFTVTPTAAGAAAGSVVFSFEDSVGTPIEVRRDFSMDVMEMIIPEDPGMKPPMEPEKPNYLLYGGIGAGVLLLLGGGTFLFLRRRKKMRLNLLRAEDMMAAAQTEIPEIEYVGFDQTEVEAPPTEAEPKE